jgi:hypothetical protein
LQHFTAFADIHLLAPAFLRQALANRSVDEPAEMSRPELPCRAILSSLHRAFFDQPTGPMSIREGLLQGKKQQRLAFGMDRYLSQTLLKALNGSDGYAQKLGHLFLGFPQDMPDFRQFAFIHFKTLSKYSFSFTIPHQGSTSRTARPDLHLLISAKNPLLFPYLVILSPYIPQAVIPVFIVK